MQELTIDHHHFDMKGTTTGLAVSFLTMISGRSDSCQEDGSAFPAKRTLYFDNLLHRILLLSG